MVEAPAVRAGWIKLAIGFVKRLPEPAASGVLDRLGGTRARAREVTFRDFIEVDHLVRLATATTEVLGSARAKLLWQEVMCEALKQPAIGELVRRAGVGNRAPLPLLERTADAFRFVHRSCGEWTVVGDPTTRSAVVTLERAAREILDAPAMLSVYSGNLGAAVVSLGIDPQVFAVAEQPSRRMRFKVRW